MENTLVNKTGYYAALGTVALTVLTFGIAFLTPPLSGPYCAGGCFSYPYSDIAARFPRDYYWMIPAILLSLVYYTLMASIHYSAPADRKIFSHLGLSFALISTATLVIDYFIQLSIIQPSLLQGETDGIAILSQFNAHGVFIVLEEIGFSMMSLSMLCMAPVFVGKTASEKAIRWLFVGCFLLTVLAFVIYTATYGVQREYRFEVAAISINWLTLIAVGALLSRFFHSALSETAPRHRSSVSRQNAGA
jgi:hypothetical protein